MLFTTKMIQQLQECQQSMPRGGQDQQAFKALGKAVAACLVEIIANERIEPPEWFLGSSALLNVIGNCTCCWLVDNLINKGGDMKTTVLTAPAKEASKLCLQIAKLLQYTLKPGSTFAIDNDMVEITGVLDAGVDLLGNLNLF